MANLKYKRILLKLSGEAMGGESGFGINVSEVDRRPLERRSKYGR